MAKRKWADGKGERERKQIGVKLDVDLWRELRILALEKDRTAGDLLEEAMREYVARHKRGRK